MKIINFKILPAISLLIMAGCGNGEKQESVQQESEFPGAIPVTTEQFKMSGMALGSIEEVILPKFIGCTGTIDVPPENKALVNAYQPGYIKETSFLIGDVVRKGQQVATLESPEYIQMQQEYMEIAGRLTYLEAEYKRQQTLLEEQVTSQKNYLKAESDYKSALATYTGLRKTLQMLHLDPSALEQGHLSPTIPVLAPIAGIISRVFISKGTYVSPDKPILEIIDNDHMHLELAVFEKDILKIKKGQEIKFRIPEATDSLYEGEVYLVGNSLEAGSRTVKVHGHFREEKPMGFAVGMFIEAQIVTGSARVMALPEAAVVHLEGGDFVCQLRLHEKGNYQLSRVKVITGDTAGGYTVIENSSDFEEGAQFLTKGAYAVLTNQ
jgi:cobalt-zinc-cadmium efflux system membrane fusion protein